MQPSHHGPLYAQISDKIRSNIQTEKWPEGQRIPTEMELCEIYHVSRITIRKAIDELVRENLLYRERAKGTFVKEFSPDAKSYSTRVKGFTQELMERGQDATTLWALVEKSHADHKIAKYLNSQPGTEILVLRRVRGEGKNILAYFKTHLIYQPDYSLNTNDYYGSLYTYLKEFGIEINQEKEYIEAIAPSKEVQQRLKISENEPVLKRVRFTKQIEKNFYEYTECYYIGRNYRYYLDFE